MPLEVPCISSRFLPGIPEGSAPFLLRLCLPVPPLRILRAVPISVCCPAYAASRSWLCPAGKPLARNEDSASPLFLFPYRSARRHERYLLLLRGSRPCAGSSAQSRGNCFCTD